MFEPFLGKGVDQVAVLVEDLDRAVETYWKLLGIGPWRLYTYRKPFVPTMSYRGRPGDYGMRVGLATAGPLIVELIQPLAGESIYAEFVSKHGFGLHHVGIVVTDLRAVVAEAEAAGWSVVMSGAGYGLDGDGAYAYLDTEESLGITIEDIELPKRRAEPARIYPPAG